MSGISEIPSSPTGTTCASFDAHWFRPGAAKHAEGPTASDRPRGCRILALKFFDPHGLLFSELLDISSAWPRRAIQYALRAAFPSAFLAPRVVHRFAQMRDSCDF